MKKVREKSKGTFYRLEEMLVKERRGVLDPKEGYFSCKEKGGLGFNSMDFVIMLVKKMALEVFN